MIFTARIEKSIGSLDKTNLWLARYLLVNGVHTPQCARFTLEWENMDSEYTLPSASISLPDEAIPAILQAMVNAGKIAPEAFSSDREIKALRDHLADMRKLLFHETGVNT